MKIGGASYELLYLIVRRSLRAGVSLIAETNFNGPLACERLSVIREETGCLLIELHCFAAPELLLQRFRDRWASGGRHAGHVAHELPLDDPSLGVAFASGNPAVAVGDELMEVDTTDPERIDWKRIVSTVRQAMRGNDGSRDR
jgi:hypothetical protein